MRRSVAMLVALAIGASLPALAAAQEGPPPPPHDGHDRPVGGGQGEAGRPGPPQAPGRPDRPEAPGRPDRPDGGYGDPRGGRGGPGWQNGPRPDHGGQPDWRGGPPRDPDGRPGWQGDPHRGQPGPGWHGPDGPDGPGGPAAGGDPRWGGGGRDHDGAGWRGPDRGGPAWHGSGGAGGPGWHGAPPPSRPWGGPGWRHDNRYDWRGWRDRNGGLFRAGPYAAPYGWRGGYRRFGIGARLAPPLFSDSYWLDDPWAYRLPPVSGPYRWIRYYDDVLLVDLRRGSVVDVIPGFFW